MNASLLPLVTIIIPTYLGGNSLKACLKSIVASTYSNTEVFVVDNCLDRGLMRQIFVLFRKYKWIKFIKTQQNLYFAESINLGLSQSNGEYVLIFNDDALLLPNSIDEMVKPLLKFPKLGAVQPKVLLPNGKIDSMGGAMDTLGFAYKLIRPNHEKLFYISIGMFRKSALDFSGAYDPNMIIYWEDVDISWRIHLAGYALKYAGNAVIVHQVSQTTKKQNEGFKKFHIRKNRLMGLIKNYSLFHVFIFVPLLILSYIFLIIYEILLYNKQAYPKETFQAILWNIHHLNETLQKRHYIQKFVRRIDDTKILPFMRLPNFFDK